VLERFAAAARAMRADGWWWADAALSNRAIRRGILREMISQRFQAYG
jgi:glutamate-1-semialdehyde 2,1-aminomutase